MSLTSNSLPVVLTIGGSDCSAGAGIQADLKAIHSLECYGVTAVTGIVAESPLEVISWQATSPELLKDQLDVVLRDFPVAVVKTGLLFSPDLVSVVAECLHGRGLPLVIDPVGSASAGAEFGGLELREALVKELIPLASLVTPNLPEARLLLGMPEADIYAAEELGESWGTSVLIKGGHNDECEAAVDMLWSPELGLVPHELPWVDGPDYHGTGCTLSAAIAANLALGLHLSDAISEAKQLLHDAMQNGLAWEATTALDIA